MLPRPIAIPLRFLVVLIYLVLMSIWLIIFAVVALLVSGNQFFDELATEVARCWPSGEEWASIFD